MKLVYLGTPDMAVPPLRALVEAGHEVVLVVTRADKRRGRGGATTPSPVKAAALELGLTVTHQADDVIRAAEQGAELGVVVAFGQIIKPHVLAALPMVNVHFSLLPRWRGAAPVERAILAGDDLTGVCVMRVEEGLDTGGVYAVRRVPISDTVTAEELRAELVTAGTELLVETLAAPVAEWIGAAHPQDGEVTYAHKFAAGRLRDRLDRPGRRHPPAHPRRRRVDDVPVEALEDPRRRARRRSHRADARAARGPAGDDVRCVAQRRPPRSDRTVRHAVTSPARRGSSTSGASRPAERTPNARQPNARQVALAVLRRIEDEGAYANLALGPALQQSQLGELDRKFVTELVYGTTRMRRACDSLVDRFVASPPDPVTRSVLRLGAYQLAYAGVPPHAAVGETVGLAPKRTRGLVNAVLRKVSRLSVDEQVWPSDGARLSYPDWIVDTFRAELSATSGRPRWRG